MSDAPRVAVLSVHTSPVDQPGIGDSGGMNVYILEVAGRLAAQGVHVDVFARCRGGTDHEVKEVATGLGSSRSRRGRARRCRSRTCRATCPSSSGGSCTTLGSTGSPTTSC